MKTKRFCVSYGLKIYYDASVEAKTADEARKKVEEVIGDGMLEVKVWEVTNATV